MKPLRIAFETDRCCRSDKVDLRAGEPRRHCACWHLLTIADGNLCTCADFLALGFKYVLKVSPKGWAWRLFSPVNIGIRGISIAVVRPEPELDGFLEISETLYDL